MLARTPAPEPEAVVRLRRARLLHVVEPTLDAQVLEDIITAIVDREHVAGEDECARLRRGRSWIEGQLARELTR